MPPRDSVGHVVQGLSPLSYFDGVSVIQMTYDPQDKVPHKTTTVYYCQDHFQAVDLDVRRASTTSDRDFRHLGFIHDHPTCASYLVYPGDQSRLDRQRTDQPWIPQLFPNHYHARQGHRNEPAGVGGLIGDISLLIALLAHSVPDQYVSWALQNCIRTKWTAHTLGSSQCKCIALMRYHLTHRSQGSASAASLLKYGHGLVLSGLPMTGSEGMKMVNMERFTPDTPDEHF